MTLRLWSYSSLFAAREWLPVGVFLWVLTDGQLPEQWSVDFPVPTIPKRRSAPSPRDSESVTAQSL